MTGSYAEIYRRKRDYLEHQVQHNRVSERDANAIKELADAFDDSKPTVKRPRWESTKLSKSRKKSTLANWVYYLTYYALETELCDTTAYELNSVAETWISQKNTGKPFEAQGEEDSSKVPSRKSGLSTGTVRAYQNSLRMFYRYHTDLGIDHAEISVFDTEETSVSEKDMLTQEEIQQLRNSTDHPRDLFVINMLLCTGMRNNALRHLRVKDINLDPNEKTYYFNTTVEGLKDIHNPNASRPLLGAFPSLIEWMKYHPEPDDPEAYVITGKPRYCNPDHHKPVSKKTIERIVDNAKEAAGIQKKLTPHILRHNMVSICKAEGMDDSTLKHLIGHAPDSNIMNSTYSHISAEEHTKIAEETMGIRDEQDQAKLSPTHCDICNERLAPNARLCHKCGQVYTHDAKSVQDQIDDDMYEAKGEVGEDLSEDLDTLRKIIRENPELESLLVNNH